MKNDIVNISLLFLFVNCSTGTKNISGANHVILLYTAVNCFHSCLQNELIIFIILFDILK